MRRGTTRTIAPALGATVALAVALGPALASGQETTGAAAPPADPPPAEPAAPRDPKIAGPDPTSAGPASAPTPVGNEPDLPDLEEGGEGPSGPKLDIYGFSDFTFWLPLMSESNKWRPVFDPYSRFAVGNLNVYLSSALGQRWRSLAEIRFTYLPNGVPEGRAADGSYTRTDTTVIDPAEFGREIQWGGIVIERAWIEYVAHERLTLRAGQWLTPYGVWNVDHGSPAIIGIRRPYIVRELLFPERQTGLELYGSAPIAGAKLGYHLTLSNGRGPIDAYRDYDANKAVGGRAYLQWDDIGELTIGGSFYAGRYTSVLESWVLDAQGYAKAERSITAQYDERSVAADLRWQFHRLLVQSEGILNDRVYVTGHRPPLTGSPGLFAPDLRRAGVYLLAGFRTPLYGVMPYAVVEYYRLGPGALPPQAGDLPETRALFLGLNMRPHPAVVLKAELNYLTFPGAHGLGTSDVFAFQSQVAWVF